MSAAPDTMTLDAWMTDQRVSTVDMAERCKVAVSTISRIRRGLQIPDPPLARTIVRLTDNVVSYESLLNPKPVKKRA